MKKRFFSLLKALLVSKIAMQASADGTVYDNGDVTVGTQAGADNGGTLFSDLVRKVYSQEIEYKALPIMRFLQFAYEQTELNVEPGHTISMLTYDNLALGGVLEEMQDMQTQALSGSSKELHVYEHGNAVAVTEMLLRSSFRPVMDDTTNLLGRDYAMVMDTELRDVALSGTNVVYGGGRTRRQDITAADKLTVSVIKDALEVLATFNAPKVGNAFWICFVHPHQSRDLRDDPAWINASNYGNPEQLFNGEIGRIDDVRFIETTIMCNGDTAGQASNSYKAYLAKGFAGDADNPALSNCNIYQAVIFGDRYYAVAWSLPVELRNNGVQDFGRKRSLAWYAIWGTGVLHNDYGVVIETA